MKAVLICPADRSEVPELATRVPLAILPLLGRSALEYWLEALATEGIRQVTVLAADRPNRVREHIGDGRRWGLQVDVVPTPHEFTEPEARARFAAGADPVRIVTVDTLPGVPELPLWETYEGWFRAVLAFLPHAVTPGRIGVRQVRPGVWVGLRAEIDPTAVLTAPCWIGDNARIEAGARVGPQAVVDERSVVERGARVLDSIVGPDTYVGRFVSVEASLAEGALLVNWRSDSSVHVPDPFLLGELATVRRPRAASGLLGRIAAGTAMLVTLPFAAGVVGLSLLRGESPWVLRLALRPQRDSRRLVHDTFGYYELTGARTWLRRWPQFWSVVRGDMAWIGNRPLRPTQAMALANDFERLWLTAPVGLISLADARGCPEGITAEAVGHASFYAVNAGRRIDWFILSRSLIRAALVWPIPGHRRKEPAMPLEELVPKQEL